MFSRIKPPACATRPASWARSARRRRMIFSAARTTAAIKGDGAVE